MDLSSQWDSLSLQPTLLDMQAPSQETFLHGKIDLENFATNFENPKSQQKRVWIGFFQYFKWKCSSWLVLTVLDNWWSSHFSVNELLRPCTVFPCCEHLPVHPNTEEDQHWVEYGEEESSEEAFPLYSGFFSLHSSWALQQTPRGLLPWSRVSIVRNRSVHNSIARFFCSHSFSSFSK